MESLNLRSEPLCPGTWQRKVPQGVAFVVTFIQALAHILPSYFILCASGLLLMAFDSGMPDNLVVARRLWMEVWLMIACFVTIFSIPLLTTAPGLVLGFVWITGKAERAQIQARRVARLSFPLLIVSSCIAAACLMVTLVGRSWQTLPLVAWFAVMAACSMSLFSHAQLHSPPPPEETRGMLLAALLLFGSLYQIGLTPLLCGATYSYSDVFSAHKDPDPPAVLAMLDKVHAGAIFLFVWVTLACGILGVGLALQVFFSNRDCPDMKYLQLHARVITAVMVGSGPVPVVLDGLWFLLTPSLGLASVHNCWSVLQQPLACMLFLLGILWVNRTLGKVWDTSEQVPPENSEDVVLLADS